MAHTYGCLGDVLLREGGCIIRVEQRGVAQVVRAVERGVQRGEIQDGHRVAVQAIGLALDWVHQVGALTEGYGVLEARSFSSFKQSVQAPGSRP